VNAAEVHHRLRVMRQNELSSEMKSHVGPLPITGDSVRGTIDVILDGEEAVSKDEIFNKLIHQKVEIVLTAHPTEVNRKSLLRKCKFDNRIVCTYSVFKIVELTIIVRSLLNNMIWQYYSVVWCR
jgi:phosphoenolpyruvate carboxylase